MKKPTEYEHEFLITYVKYENGVITETLDVFKTVKSKYKRHTAGKHIEARTRYDLNRDTGKLIKDQWKYYSLF